MLERKTSSVWEIVIARHCASHNACIILYNHHISPEEQVVWLLPMKKLKLQEVQPVIEIMSG